MSQSPAEEPLSACEPDVAKLVGKEILENRLDPAAWATALLSCDGKRQEALAIYARIRMQQVGSHRRLRQSKSKSFECRRVKKCFGVKTVQDLLQRSHPGRQLNFLKPRLSVISLVTLGIGSAGSVGSLGRLFGNVLPEAVSTALPVMAIFAGTGVVAAAVALRFFLPKRLVMLGWNTGLLAACSFACCVSLLCGVKLTARAEPLEFKQNPLTDEVVMAAPASSGRQSQGLAAITGSTSQ